MDLILWRHAEAVEGTSAATTWHAQLTPKGERQAERMAEWLNRRLAAFDARPGQPGAALPADGAGARPQVQDASTRSRPGASAQARARRRRLAGGQRARSLIVGHQPTLGLAAALALVGVAQPWPIKKGGGLVDPAPAARRRGPVVLRRCSRPTASRLAARDPRVARQDGVSAGCSTPVRLQASTSSRSRCSARGCVSAQPAPSASVGCAAVARQRDLARRRHRRAHGRRSPRAAGRAGAARSVASCSAPRACAGRRAGRAPGRRCAAAGSARSPARRRGRARRRCAGDGRGARSSSRSRAAPPPSAARAAPRSASSGRDVVEQREGDAPRRARPARCRPGSGAAARAPRLRGCPGRAPRRGARRRRAARSKITPWRSAPRAGCSSSMPKCIASV